MIGDILFYKSHVGLADELIKLWEGGIDPFVHVAIQISDKNKIEALYKGVVISEIDNSKISASYATPYTNSAGWSSGFSWLMQQPGKFYGYGDIVDVVLQHPIIECHYDCSALATKFLQLIGDGHVSHLGDDNIHLVTPQMLADMLGVK